MIKIALAGAHGKMGREIAQLAEQDPQFELVATLVRNPAQSSPTPPHLFDVFIDFSVKEALSTHLDLCMKAKSAMVIGITGLSEGEREKLRRASQALPIVYATNMSMGVNLTFNLIELLAKKMGQPIQSDQPDIAIHEIHHRLKKDAPSGTAIKMQDLVLGALGKTLGKDGHEMEIPITSQRIGGVPGEHTVVFALEGERIEITHKAENRAIFARGALQAARWVVGKPPGLYDMQDVLGLKPLC